MNTKFINEHHSCALKRMYADAESMLCAPRRSIMYKMKVNGGNSRKIETFLLSRSISRSHNMILNKRMNLLHVEIIMRKLSGDPFKEHDSMAFHAYHEYDKGKHSLSVFYLFFVS